MVLAMASLPPPAAVGTTMVSGRSLEAITGKAKHAPRHKTIQSFLFIVHFSNARSSAIAASNLLQR
jgi:hypothetical protein